MAYNDAGRDDQLRDRLAKDRMKLAIERTLLAYSCASRLCRCCRSLDLIHSGTSHYLQQSTDMLGSDWLCWQVQRYCQPGRERTRLNLRSWGRCALAVE